MKQKDMINLLSRGAAAIEHPWGLTEIEKDEVVEDLLTAANEMTTNIWFIGICKTTNTENVPGGYDEVTREEADMIMEVIGGKIVNDELDGVYNVELPKAIDAIMIREGTFTFTFVIDGVEYELNADRP